MAQSLTHNGAQDAEQPRVARVVRRERDSDREARYFKPVLRAVVALLMLITAAVAFSRVSGVGQVTLPDTPAKITRTLAFIDQADGSILVRDVTTAQTVDVLAGGTNGFIRGVMRGLVRERKINGLAGLGPDAPFLLFQRTDGRLSLKDPSTGRVIELDAFGRDNAGAFARLLMK